MKKTHKIAFSGIIVALIVSLMLSAYFPYFTYSAPAAAALLIAVLVIEIGRKWAFGAYIASSFLTLIFCEKEAAVLYVGFFGYYIILKGIIEEKFSRTIEFILKQIIFNIAVVISYFAIEKIFGIPFDETGKTGFVFKIFMLVAGNIVFVIYDIGISRVISGYIYKIHPKIVKMFK